MKTKNVYKFKKVKKAKGIVINKPFKRRIRRLRSHYNNNAFSDYLHKVLSECFDDNYFNTYNHGRNF